MRWVRSPRRFFFSVRVCGGLGLGLVCWVPVFVGGWGGELGVERGREVEWEKEREKEREQLRGWCCGGGCSSMAWFRGNAMWIIRPGSLSLEFLQTSLACVRLVFFSLSLGFSFYRR